MAQTQILETDKQVTVDQAIENYKRELDATGEDLTGSRPFAAGIFGLHRHTRKGQHRLQ
jgi:hypothetical protein